MMKLKLLTAMAVILTCMSVQGAPRDRAAAREVAARFVSSHGERFTRVNRAPQATALSLAYEAPKAEFFVFNCPDEAGYVLVSGDDLLPQPVLGWADEGGFDYDNAPDHVRYWFDEYARYIEYVRHHPSLAPSAAPSLASAVSPLLAERWDQGDPYNRQCPTYTSDGSTKYCVTGCVATAMAQVMHYYKYPSYGTGSISYTYNLNGDESQSRTLTRSFNHSLNWSSMTNTYSSSSTTTQCNAVATLMADCGASVRMTYGSTSSSSVLSIPAALATNFGYNKDMEVCFRDACESDEWLQLIYTELKAARPVITGAASETGGHAFVYDGCTTDGYIHVNWGWGGSSNGYFLLNDLSPKTQGIGGQSGTYQFRQYIITGMRPSSSGSTNYSILYEAVTCDATSVSKTSTLTIKFKLMSYLPVCTTAYEYDLEVGFGVFKANETGSFLNTIGLSSYTYKNGWSYNSTRSTTASASFSDLSDGTYWIMPLYRVNNKYYHMQMNRIGDSQVIIMKVSGNTITFSNGTVNSSSVTVDLSTENSKCYTSQPIYAKATFYNQTSSSFYFDVRLALYDSYDNEVSKAAVTRIDVPGNGTYEIKADLTAPSTAGKYYLTLLNDEDEILVQKSVTVYAATPGTLSRMGNLKIPSSVMPANNVRGSLQLKCTGGPYIGRLMFYILDENYHILKRVYTGILDLKDGDVVTASIKTDMTDFDTTGATTYVMAVQKPTTTSAIIWANDAVSFRLGKPADYDVNQDGVVDVADVSEVIDVVLGKKNNPRADVTGDGNVDIDDVSAVIKAVLGV